MSAKEPRKITSNKFVVTLPKDWRDSLGLTPQDELIPHYQDGSPLILTPSKMKLDPLESQLITLLVSYRSVKEARDVADTLQRIIDVIREGAQ